MQNLTINIINFVIIVAPFKFTTQGQFAIYKSGINCQFIMAHLHETVLTRHDPGILLGNSMTEDTTRFIHFGDYYLKTPNQRAPNQGGPDVLRHEKTYFMVMQTTMVHVSLHIRAV